MPLTADDIVEQAFGRVGELGDGYPTARGPMWRRVGFRQRELFALAAKLNPERFGTCATSALQTVSGKRVIDVSDIVSPVPTPELIQRIEIADKGTSSFTNGDEVHLVTPRDRDAEFPPRAYLRDRLIVGVSTDLDLVTSLEIFYPRLPELFTLTDETKVLEIEAPWDTLLELDLAKWLIAKATQMDPAKRAAAIASFAQEEQPLATAFEAHVVAYGAAVSRFALPRPHTEQPK